ncbi:cold-shock protein [Nakamurella antarctica]|uniref:Cold-shock protein n=1 Tax=Nakamurella antarctica TaxID=1902245 RepID=A0A3G8ZRB4_9ACTN|nr:cold-shock protein [Nakamurella antarctica]
MPSGRVKWYDAEKGFGFVSQENGDDVHVRASCLPAGVAALKPGQKVEFSVADGRRGPQALQVWLVDAPPSVVAAVAAANRRPADELHGVLEDVIKLIDSKILPELSRGRYPDKATGKRIGDLLRAVAGELDIS